LKWLILIVVNAVYFFVYFHRVSPAVLAPYLIESFQASAVSLGAMSSAYFYPYAFSQPLVGFLTDRWGSRKVITLATVIACGGAILCGLAPTLWIAAVGRGLIGLGAGGVFVPALHVLIPWFGPSAISQMNAILLAVGNLGAITASAPYAWFIQQTGWRFSFLLIAGITLILVVLSWTQIHDHPPQDPPLVSPGRKRDSPFFVHFFEILRSPFFWLAASLFFFYGGPISTFQGLWGYPFLIDVYGYDRLAAANLLMIIALGVIFGGPILVWFAERKFPQNIQRVLSVLLVGQLVIWCLIVFLGLMLNTFALGIILFLMGMSHSGTLSLFWAVVREATPPEKLGTMMGLTNPFPFLAIALFQPFTGYLMDRVGKIGQGFPFGAYQLAFFPCIASTAIAFVISLTLSSRKKE
jgi:predicted MFS family arabinose efflux permease